MVKSILRYTLVILCLLSCVFSSSCKTGEGGTDTEKMPDTAEVTAEKEPEEKVTFTVPVKKIKGNKLLYMYEYSPDGRSVSMTDYTEETPITYTVTFDGAGKPLKTEWTVTVNDERSEAWYDSYDEFDEEGRVTLERRYCEGQIENAFAYTYNEAGDIETQTTRNVKQENITYRLLYDDMGTHTGTRFKKYNGENGYYSEKKIFEYDSEGRIVSEKGAALTVLHEYKLSEGFIVREKITHESADGEAVWSYYYQYSYENGKLTKKDCSFEGEVTESEEFCQTELSHYKWAIDWIFRERLP